MTSKNDENWKCDYCHKEKDDLYFVGNKQLCENCKRKITQGKRKN